jgi:hypothetical protein
MCQLVKCRLLGRLFVLSPDLYTSIKERLAIRNLDFTAQLRANLLLKSCRNYATYTFFKAINRLADLLMTFYQTSATI